MQAQTVSSSLPKVINTNDNFLFYTHGAVVSVLGDNAVNNAAPEWGPYEYSNILDSLSKRGFHVISEIRNKDVNDSVYVIKIKNQLDSLLNTGVKPGSIVLLGASAGWDITLRVADRMRRKDLRYGIMGGCWPDTYKEYDKLNLYGHYLSIIETSDPHGTCVSLFNNRTTQASFKEIKLNTGLSHGFFYRGRNVWIDPVIDWFRSF